MRQWFNGTHYPKKQAKRLKHAFTAFGCFVKLGHAQEIVASMFGYADWHELERSCGQFPPSTPDRYASPEERATRQARYLQVLTGIGIAPDAAARVLEFAGFLGALGANATELRALAEHAPESFEVVRDDDVGYRIAKISRPDAANWSFKSKRALRQAVPAAWP